ncbi:hypothetical protein [Streptomyces sp. NRRL F-5727]|uniref:hypothetical protein n=1 Tax=Streptomyces sp. NRRL F-5727 TaxID=1463871 RepID=UPI00055E2ACC|nr:hypothetical protein [Streptomyces sp. NRRL F-5727]
MIKLRRVVPPATVLLFTVALAVGATGWATGTDPLTDAGTLGTLAAVPLLYWVMITRTHEVTDQQLEKARQQGYVMAMDHVGRGLIDAPVPPSPGLCGHCGRHASPADVISLDERRRSGHNPKEKRTQTQ